MTEKLAFFGMNTPLLVAPDFRTPWSREDYTGARHCCASRLRSSGNQRQVNSMRVVVFTLNQMRNSDTRSAQSIDDRVRPILESGSAVGSTKPILLIIDEIDGATGGGGDNVRHTFSHLSIFVKSWSQSSSFVQKLVSLTLDKPKKKRTAHLSYVTYALDLNCRIGKAGAQSDTRPLLRPIICICNDQNAHSLAKLRPHARQIRYTRPADVHIVRRLREICELEELSADARALSTLVNVAKGDLRGCLNTLQVCQPAPLTGHMIRLIGANSL